MSPVQDWPGSGCQEDGQVRQQPDEAHGEQGTTLIDNTDEVIKHYKTNC